MAKLLLLLPSLMIMHLISLVLFVFAQDEKQFIYNGFKEAHNLHLDGPANISPNGLLQMTNFTVHQTAHVFYPRPINFHPNSSFSTTFIFALHPQIPDHPGHGIVFVISPSMNFQYALPSGYLGLFNNTNNGLSSNHIFGIEFDTIQNIEFADIDANHVGIDINSLRSNESATASYFSDKEGVNKSILLISGNPMQVWIDYDGVDTLINVTIAPFGFPKPSKCLLSKHYNLSTVLLNSMYVGFSSCTGVISNSNYILGWSWNQSGKAQNLDLSKLPSLPRIKNQKKSFNLTFIVLLVFLLFLFLALAVAGWVVRRKKYEELREPWEQEYAPHRFLYKDLYVATKGFRTSELLGVGGFGKVFKGVLPTNHTQVAVKQVSHDSRQGMKEFVAEIASMRRLRHRNLVQLLGYCRRKGELLLVYDYMPNGSLDKFLFCKDNTSKINWSQRFKIVKGVASALLYLHEEWEQVVLHRDVKASNVLLDEEMNARLGDFGLARLYDHNTDPRTTHVVGTMGYIAPESARTRKPTTSSDVFAFGVFLLEVACGRRPLKEKDDAQDPFLLDWVYDCWKKGVILEASDPKLEGNYVGEEMEVVLKLGLLCSHPKPEARPSMKQVVQIMNGVGTLPEIPSDYDPQSNDFFVEGWTASSYPSSFPSSSIYDLSSSTNSIGLHGR